MRYCWVTPRDERTRLHNIDKGHSSHKNTGTSRVITYPSILLAQWHLWLSFFFFWGLSFWHEELSHPLPPHFSILISGGARKPLSWQTLPEVDVESRCWRVKAFFLLRVSLLVRYFYSPRSESSFEEDAARAAHSKAPQRRPVIRRPSERTDPISVRSRRVISFLE